MVTFHYVGTRDESTATTMPTVDHCDWPALEMHNQVWFKMRRFTATIYFWLLWTECGVPVMNEQRKRP
jgi:hypothetical protein